MRKTFGLLLLGVLTVGLWLWSARDPFVNALPGVIVSEPVQTNTEVPPFDFLSFEWIPTTYHITPIANYDIQARVLHTKRFYSDRFVAGLIPFDVGLGWQVMSDPSLLGTYFSFDHKGDTGGGRILWTSWQTDKDGNPRVPPPELGDTMGLLSNNHLIPANKKIFRQLAGVRAGDLVRLHGFLVNISKPTEPSWQWRTSVTRSDTSTHWGGDNTSCETLFVTKAEIITSIDPLMTAPLPECWWCW